ncbi:MAG: 5-bromo-4-chloroindolyl phosphate hydrolysis family protein [Lachnospiraceae bacterium]|nr:5-bromo-4-chloroindolyl phosphate hydrolysis family protein [Lachnospiraceae bacterium]
MSELMKVKHKKIPVAPMYAFAITWLLLAVLRVPIGSVGIWFLYLFLASFVGGVTFGAQKLIAFARAENKVLTDTLENTGNVELDQVLASGNHFMKELNASKSIIQNASVIADTDEIIDVTIKIMTKLYKKPKLVASAQSFFDYYLPTTVKIISNYSDMEKQGAIGENVCVTMEKIESTLSKLAMAYKSQLDKLFAQTSIEIETELSALESMLAMDGLLIDEKHDMKRFMENKAEVCSQ